MAIEDSIRQSSKDRHSAIRILTPRRENFLCDNSNQSHGLILKTDEPVKIETMIRFQTMKIYLHFKNLK